MIGKQLIATSVSLILAVALSPCAAFAIVPVQTAAGIEQQEVGESLSQSATKSSGKKTIYVLTSVTETSSQGDTNTVTYKYNSGKLLKKSYTKSNSSEVTEKWTYNKKGNLSSYKNSNLGNTVSYETTSSSRVTRAVQYIAASAPGSIDSNKETMFAYKSGRVDTRSSELTTPASNWNVNTTDHYYYNKKRASESCEEQHG